MKIVLINTFETQGGAAIACTRLLNTLLKVPELDVHLLTQEKKTSHPHSQGFSEGYLSKKMAYVRFIRERLSLWSKTSNKKARFAFSPANVGTDITQHPLVQEADILHLHWINFGFLSLNSLEKLLNLGKPVLWTLHDMWAFTGGCHYVGTCRRYEDACGQCPFLSSTNDRDWSRLIWIKKSIIYKSANLHILPVSRWLSIKAGESSLLQKKQIKHIPNPIDIDQFRFKEKEKVQRDLNLPTEKFILLFGSANINDPRKGFKYLLTALEKLRERFDISPSSLSLLIFGKNKQSALDHLPYEVIDLGTLPMEKVIQAYQAANLFVLPSLEDNLPNTVMESLSCGTPVLAFDTGGIPEMLEHKKNGYLAQYQSAEDLSNGIYWVYQLYQENLQAYNQLCDKAREKVETTYSEDIISKVYKDFYQEVIRKGSN